MGLAAIGAPFHRPKVSTHTDGTLGVRANGEAEVSYESLQKMVQGLVKGLDDERKEISVEDATVLSVNPKQLMDECEELLAKIVDSLSKPLLMD